MNRLTIEYQPSALAITSPTISAISQTGVSLVTAVAKTLAKSTIAFGIGERDQEQAEQQRVAAWWRPLCEARSLAASLSPA